MQISLFRFRLSSLPRLQRLLLFLLREVELRDLADVLLGLAGELVRGAPPQLDPVDLHDLVAGVGHLDRLRYAPALLGLQVPARLGLQGQLIPLR